MTKRRRRRYTDDFRASAVLMLEAAGYPGIDGALTAVSNRLDVPHPTLIRWFTGQSNPPPSELVQKKKVDLKAELTELLHLHITSAKTAVQDAGLGDIDRGIGILFDKLQLLDNRPTAIFKLQEAIQDGRISMDEAVKRWPSLTEKLSDSVRA